MNKDRLYIEKLLKALKRVADEEQWIEECGATLAGYVERYGSSLDNVHFGDGGEAIFAADTSALDDARTELHTLIDRHQFDRRDDRIYWVDPFGDGTKFGYRQGSTPTWVIADPDSNAELATFLCGEGEERARLIGSRLISSMLGY